ncbi:MAG: outer membrane beta-barrel protein [Phycisphaerales bacterium]|nr:outer membrane beta-barrel protein [Hyphomonadaceae bacterium]
MAGISSVAHATEGWYGRADVGWSIDGELDGEFDDGINTGDFNTDLEDGFLGAIGAGYGFGNGFRLEGELSYRNNQWGPTNIPDPPDGEFQGDVNTWALMANLFYDFNRGGTFQPYLGVGAGGAKVDLGIDGAGSQADEVFAYQGLAGVGIRLSENAMLDIGYRYFMAPEVDASETFGGAYSSEYDYEHQAVTVGLRFAFGAAAAPPAADPPPVYTQPPVVTPPVVTCPTSDFVVYFEWDRSNLNQAALETIDAAVNRARECNVSGVVVVGHTDTSGSPAYNEALSERRASVVRDALVARGLAAGALTTQARGETDLARPTNDGVREPLNRRTAVTISFR